MTETKAIKGEKRMSKLLKALAGIASLGLAGSASAEIVSYVPGKLGTQVITHTVTPGTGDLAGFEIHRYFTAFHPTASLEGAAGANGVQSLKVQLSTNTSFKFLVGEFAAPSFPTNRDIDLVGANADDATYRTA